MDVVQFKPAHADRIDGYDWSNKKGFNYLEDMLKNEVMLVQRKHDGERIKMHILHNETVMDSRRVSKKTGLYAQCQQNFPEFQNLGLDIGYTVLDGELKAIRDGKDSWSDIVGVIHSLPERAAALKATNEFKIVYMAFDCCFYDGVDLRDRPYNERCHYLELALKKINREDIQYVESFVCKTKEDIYRFRDEFIAKGYEGIVVKSTNRKYYDVGAYIKAKRLETKDIVVYGFEYGNGKYSETVGCLKCGYWDPESQSVVHITNVNCGTDQDRADWLKGLLDCSRQNAVIEVKCQEVTDTSLRHPVYVRLRLDKDYKMCTRDTVFSSEEH